MFAQFSTQYLLAIRSPQIVFSQCVDIGLRLAALGHISQSVEIIKIASEVADVKLNFLYARGLYFAWEAIGSWPAVVPEEHRQVSWLKEYDESATLHKWATSAHPRVGSPPETLDVDELGLKKLLDVIDEKEGTEGMLNYARKDVVTRVTRPAAVYMALDFSLQQGRHDDDVQKFLSIIVESKDPDGIAKSRRAWQILKGGYMSEKWNDGEDVLAQFEKLRDVLAERAEKGVQRPLKILTMREFLDRLDRNTIKHDEDEDQDILELEELQQHVFMGNRSILHSPASASDIEALEKKLQLQLPEDYKEFLSISNGLEGNWNGYFRPRDLGTTDMVQPTELIWGEGSRNSMQLELVDWTELPIKVEWPKFDLKHAVSIHDPQDEVNTWLVRPQMIRTAIEKFFVTYDSEAVDDETRKWTEKVISAHFGSLEEFRRMEWCVVTWSYWGITLDTWKTFREYMETLLLESER